MESEVDIRLAYLVGGANSHRSKRLRMRVKGRIGAELRTRGFVGFCRFVQTRLWQVRQDVLFELQIPRSADAVTRLDSVVQVDSRNLGSEATAVVERCVLTPENFAYREALQGDDRLFAATDGDGHVTSYGFVLFDSFYKTVLGETVQVPMIGNCFTFPAHRRRGLYARLLVSITDRLAEAGYTRVIITCAPDNLASVQGIRNAGFRHVRTLRTCIVLSRWIVIQTTVATDAVT